MTTVLLCPELFAADGGIQRILRLYLKALCDMAPAGGEVRLVSLNDREFPESLLRLYANQRLTHRHACARRKGVFVRRTLASVVGADRLICGHLGQLAVARLARTLHPRLDYFLVAHGIEVWRPYTRIERIALRGARRIFCVSDYTRREMRRQSGLPEARFVVLPNALDPQFSAPGEGSAAGPDDSVILTVARLDQRENYKGVDHLIEALPAVRKQLPDARLRVVGQGADLPRLRGLAAGLGVTEAVEFSGRIDDEALRAAYRDCALFALPSRNEGFGIAYLEAMAFGKPCLGARAGAVPELIDTDSGLLVDYGEHDQIAEALIRALRRDWDHAKIMARAARFSYPAFKDRLESALAV